MSKCGIVIVAHGSQLPDPEEALAKLASFLREESGGPVEVGFLSFQSPSIAEAVASVVQAGVDRVTVAPFFLTEGYLMRKAVKLAREAAPGLDMKIAPPLGQHPRLLDAVLDRADEAMGQRADAD
ncbi:sirohydrochlorin chelatase [Tumebacillus flagellatus]|uniref:Cobalamin biosynthesis protein CbiX n=1 Tax=Tumebacillus flagellatus TaxID=1157490 RepID=A0A074LNW0_9BACL|nr:CbiX/SirB N-terminal domain-containing protein [Tumebacillus flagellatus]KEO82165.1 hypothetical protein EL26_16640 [Tumebacillus flagellatus]